MTAFRFEFGRLTPQQMKVFMAVLESNDQGHPVKVLKLLRGLGLVESDQWCDVTRLSNDGEVVAVHWRVPGSVHAAWDAWRMEHQGPGTMTA